MCGIVYVKRKDNRPAYKAVLKRYRNQKGRGQNGFGYVAIKDNQVVSYQRAPTEHEIVKLLEKEDAPEIMFHHRYPTSTPNIEEAAHPILVENDMLEHQYFVLHNGVIKNTKELREGHYKLGIPYTTEIMKGFTALSTKKMYSTDLAWNDSESLAIETALAMEGIKRTIDTEGAAAVVGVQTRGKQVITRFFYRNDNHPLMFHEDKVMVSVTSLGGGTNLPSTLVFKLRQEGGFVFYGDEPVRVPKGYAYQTTVYPSRRDAEFYKTHVWDYNTKEYIPKAEYERDLRANNNEATIEQGHPLAGMGFGMGVRKIGEFFLPPKKEDRDRIIEPVLQFEDDEVGGPNDDAPPFGIKRLDEMASELRIIQRRIDKGLPFIESLQTITLWSEYNDAVEIEGSLKQVIRDMDSVIEFNGEPEDEMLEQREKVTQKLEGVSQYIARLSSELTIRESLERVLSK